MARALIALPMVLLLFALVGCAGTEPDPPSAPTAAVAAPQLVALTCARRADIAAMLESQFGEHSQGRGIEHRNVMAELFVGPSSWTWLITTPRGSACIFARGSVWRWANEVGETPG